MSESENAGKDVDRSPANHFWKKRNNDDLLAEFVPAIPHVAIPLRALAVEGPKPQFHLSPVK